MRLATITHNGREAVGLISADGVLNLTAAWPALIGEGDGRPPTTVYELLSRAERGLVTVLDVRPPEEFAAGHLPGAVNIPIDRLESSLANLSKQREVVAYCRGPYCLMSFEAVLKLRKRGWKARRLQDGFPEWKAAGLPVA